jgi:hypothetical protein
MTEESKKGKLTGPDYMRKKLEELGIKVQKVDPPKGFVRVIFPVTPENSHRSKKD